MQIEGPIQFWRGCVIYWSAPKSGLGPRENADSVHSKVGTRSTRKYWLGPHKNGDQDGDRDQTPEHILVFRALLKIKIEIEFKIELLNTSSFLGLYSRSRLRSNSGTTSSFLGLYSRSRSRSHQSTDEAHSAKVQPRKKIAWEGDKIQVTTHGHRDY